MAYREVTVIEIEEVLRQWLAGAKGERIARRVGLDPKTVRRYLRAAGSCGLAPEQGLEALNAERVAEVSRALATVPERVHGETWERCAERRDFIAEKLRSRVKLSKIRRLLARQGVDLAPATLYRFAASELGFGRTRTTMPVADGEPGGEVYLDTGWMTKLEPDASGRRRRFRSDRPRSRRSPSMRSRIAPMVHLQCDCSLRGIRSGSEVPGWREHRLRAGGVGATHQGACHTLAADRSATATTSIQEQLPRSGLVQQRAAADRLRRRLSANVGRRQVATGKPPSRRRASPDLRAQVRSATRPGG